MNYLYTLISATLMILLLWYKQWVEGQNFQTLTLVLSPLLDSHETLFFFIIPRPAKHTRNGITAFKWWTIEFLQVRILGVRCIPKSLTAGVQNHVGQQAWTSPWFTDLGRFHHCEADVLHWGGEKWQEDWSSRSPVLPWMGLYQPFPGHHICSMLCLNRKHPQSFVRKARSLW